jgi:TolB-like protein
MSLTKENSPFKFYHMLPLLKRGFALLLIFELINTNGLAQVTFDTQIKKMSDTLVARLLRTGKKRVAVSNFVDLQGNTTELGKYIAESFSVELSNTDLSVVDRSRISDLMQELKLTDEKLTKPENALKLGEMAGVEYIITGTTVPLETTVDVTIKALDIQNGISIAGQRGSVPRTDAINNLMRSNVSGGNTTAANVNAGTKIDTRNKSATDDVMEIGISDMRKNECEVRLPSTNNIVTINFLGQACFENHTDQDLLLTVYDETGATGDWIKDIILIPNGGKNCSPRISIGNSANGNTVKDITFKFTTTTTPSQSGTLVLTMEKCKIKSVVLTKRNLFLK